MKKLRWLAILMGITILGITGFQGYWLKNNYDRESQNLEIKTSADFRETILRLQASKLKLEKLSSQMDSTIKSIKPTFSVRGGQKRNKRDTILTPSHQLPITVVNLLQEKMKRAGDSALQKAYVFTTTDGPMPQLRPDSLPGGVAIRARDFRGQVETFAITSDSLPDPSLINQMDVKKQGNGSDIVTINYGRRKDSAVRHDTLSINTTAGVFIEKHEPGTRFENRFFERFANDSPGNMMIRFLYNVDSLSLRDSVTVQEITDAYTVRLKEEKMGNLSFTVSRLDSMQAMTLQPSDVTVGLLKPTTYRLSLENELAYLLKKLTLPILFSLFLVGITIASFVLLYRSLVRQRRLAELKNEFISNITHELKTPIATVGVAIEALKNFNAMDDPQRTKEYLEISQNELQRLGLLVDKVLKLSMFEKKEIELKKEQFDCKLLTGEVMNSMKLQFDKYHAKVRLHTEGENFVVEADKLHITSVIYNLLDNALKYSRENPVIDVQLKALPGTIEFSVSDNGIGIPPAYKEKIFDKFFRVPTGDRHNIKGYGLGLSYVHEVIKRHHGNVFVESELGKGSTFTATFPYV